MYLKLKENKTFINPETGQEFENLVFGIKNINITVDEKRVNYLAKAFLTRELMLEGKKDVFKESFSIQDNEESQQFTEFYTRATGQMLGVEMELAMYEFILSQPGFENFEIVT